MGSRTPGNVQRRAHARVQPAFQRPLSAAFEAARTTDSPSATIVLRIVSTPPRRRSRLCCRHVARCISLALAARLARRRRRTGDGGRLLVRAQSGSVGPLAQLVAATLAILLARGSCMLRAGHASLRGLAAAALIVARLARGALQYRADFQPSPPPRGWTAPVSLCAGRAAPPVRLLAITAPWPRSPSGSRSHKNGPLGIVYGGARIGCCVVARFGHGSHAPPIVTVIVAGYAAL